MLSPKSSLQKQARVTGSMGLAPLGSFQVEPCSQVSLSSLVPGWWTYFSPYSVPFNGCER